MRCDPVPAPGPGELVAGVMLRTARKALGCSARELAEAAGCSEGLVRRIESGELDPTLDTVERILNASGLEVRAGPADGESRYGGASPDAAEVARVRAAVEADRALREDLGAPAAGPPAGAQPHWGGEDPAPARRIGAAEGRGNSGGWAAVLVRSAIAETPGGGEGFAEAAGVDAETLERVCFGADRLSVGKLASMLERAGTGLRVRLEVYDVHDDGLHLSAVSDPQRHRGIKARAEEIFARR